MSCVPNTPIPKVWRGSPDWEELFLLSSWGCSLGFRAGFQVCVILERLLSVLRHPAGAAHALSNPYCGWMCQSKWSHGESMSSPTCSSNRSLQGCFLWNQTQSIAKLSKQRCLSNSTRNPFFPLFGSECKFDKGPLLREAVHQVVRPGT